MGKNTGVIRYFQFRTKLFALPVLFILLGWSSSFCTGQATDPKSDSSTGQGIKCYVCNSEIQTDCDDEKQSLQKYLVTCNSATAHPIANESLSAGGLYTDGRPNRHGGQNEDEDQPEHSSKFILCRKHVFTIPDQNNEDKKSGVSNNMKGVTRVIRSCGYFNWNNSVSSCTRSNTATIRNLHCQCNEEACNEASAPVISTNGPTFLTFVIVYLIASILRH